jgi:hypothetical protein
MWAIKEMQAEYEALQMVDENRLYLFGSLILIFIIQVCTN